MCLSAVTENFDPPLSEEVNAWKVFVVDPATREIFPMFFDRCTKIQPNIWVRDPNSYLDDIARILRVSTWYSYKVGFHSFLKKEDAEKYMEAFSQKASEKYIVLPVRCRRIVVKGVQVLWYDTTIFRKLMSLQSIVSEEIFVEYTANEKETKCV